MNSQDSRRAVGPDEPVMIKWKKFQQTDDFKNCIFWNGEACKGVLWTSFIAGFQAAGGVI